MQRQLGVEGGFQGRTNKLVDGCYSTWQAGLFPILDFCYLSKILKPKIDEKKVNLDEKKVNLDEKENKGGWLFDQLALQKYLLLCCQYASGGMTDQPDKLVFLLFLLFVCVLIF